MQTKLFLGIASSPELREQWETERPEPLVMVPFEGKEYLGMYLDPTTVQDLYAAADHFNSLPVDTARLVLFPQLFLG